MKKNENILYLTGLNGLRAIAAVGVLVSQLSIELESFRLNLLFGRDNNGYLSAWQLATYDVFVFFALSGFLITYLLLLEKEKRPVGIGQFYVRRGAFQNVAGTLSLTLEQKDGSSPLGRGGRLLP